MLNLFSGLAATGMANTLGPVMPVSMWPDFLASIISCILCTASLLTLGMSGGVNEKQPDGSTVKSSPIKGWLIAGGCGIFVAILVGCGLHQLRWNMANPKYYAATTGINALQNAIRY